MPGGKAWKERYDKAYPGEFQIHSPYAYDAVMVLADAMVRAGSSDPEVYEVPMSIHIETPFIESRPFSLRFGKSVWLKMEALQPSGSFKARGVGHACEFHQARGVTRFVSSSGGNAGLAVAFAGRRLDIPVVVVVPVTTSQRSKDLIQLENAQVIIGGDSWSEANEFALAMLSEDDAYIHPFDDPLLWTGHASVVDEMVRQGPKPDAIVLSVGGGGLLCGVVEGLRRNDWADVPIVAVETKGADSFAQAVAAGRRVVLPSIDSIATCLGARAVSERSLELAREHPIESIVVSDAQAVSACIAMLDDHRIVVEPACGASLAALQSASAFIERAGRVAVIACGGVGATTEQLMMWHKEFTDTATPV